jgi:siroheme synthase-like protein
MDNFSGKETKSFNPLFPVFVKLEKLNLLIVGGGYVALEKLTAVFNNSPQANVLLVAPQIRDDVRNLPVGKQVSFREQAFEESDLAGIDLVIIAINDKATSEAIYRVCKKNKVLTNVADTPDLCDFYLSSVVQKGNLKIAISTNGKSPTIAKRVKEVLTDTFPDEMDKVLDNMEAIRNRLKGDFSDKVKQLNSITTVLASGPGVKHNGSSKAVRTILYIIAALLLMVFGHFVLSLININL